jgi:hypothetical protein
VTFLDARGQDAHEANQSATSDRSGETRLTVRFFGGKVPVQRRYHGVARSSVAVKFAFTDIPLP